MWINEANEIKQVWASDAITTKSSTDNSAVKLDDSHMMDISQVNSNGKIVNPRILVYKPGNTTVTIDINGTQTSFDIVVRE